MVCVRDFHDLCPRLSPRESFGESRRTGIWTLGSIRVRFLLVLVVSVLLQCMQQLNVTFY